MSIIYVSHKQVPHDNSQLAQYANAVAYREIHLRCLDSPAPVLLHLPQWQPQRLVSNNKGGTIQCRMT